MNLSTQKQIAAKILKCGASRVKIKAGKDVEDALTREDVRNLIRKGHVWKEQKKGTSKFNVKKIVKQKKKGRMKGHGSRKGTAGARKKRKEIWIGKVRPLRSLLRELKESEAIDNTVYRKIYLMIKGGAFRNKKHLLYYLKDHELMKTKSRKMVKKVKKPKTDIKKPVVKTDKPKSVPKKEKKSVDKKKAGSKKKK
jgi:large subunit ribosomal protein L19e